MKREIFLVFCLSAAIAGCSSNEDGHTYVEAVAQVGTSDAAADLMTLDESAEDVSVDQPDSVDSSIEIDNPETAEVDQEIGGSDVDSAADTDADTADTTDTFDADDTADVIEEIAEVSAEVETDSVDAVETSDDTVQDAVDASQDATQVTQDSVDSGEDAQDTMDDTIDAAADSDVTSDVSVEDVVDALDVIDSTDAADAIDTQDSQSAPDSSDTSDMFDASDASELGDAMNDVDVPVDLCAGKNCDDANVCTADSCNTGNGACVHANLELACDDGSTCTVGDACKGGICVAGAMNNCSDGNVCTFDQCDPVAGCSNPVVVATYGEDFGTSAEMESGPATGLGTGWTGIGNWKIACNQFPYGKKGDIFSGCSAWYGNNNPQGEVYAQHDLPNVGTVRSLDFDVQRIWKDNSKGVLTLKSGVRMLNAAGVTLSDFLLDQYLPGDEPDVYYHANITVPADAASFQIWLNRSIPYAGDGGQFFWGYFERFDNVKVYPVEAAVAAQCFK